MTSTILTAEERERYARHLSLEEIGPEGQMRLKRGSVLVIGAGGLGSPVLLYLAAAGVGRIGIADGDNVDLSNLQRQVIHTTARVATPKTESARSAILAINPHTEVILHPFFLSPENIAEVIEGYDFVIDATDNFASKFMINDACVAASKPYCHGGIWHFCGQLMTWLPGHACYRCLFDTLPAPGPVAGPLGVIPGVIGSLQACEAVKFLTGIGSLLTDTLLTFDALDMTFRKITVPVAPTHPHTA